jgi:hypothetical protein
MFKALDVFFFLAVTAVSLFTFVGIAVWTKARKQERIALYRSELLTKLAEQPGEGSRQVFAMLRDEAAGRERDKRRGTILAGLICASVGLGLIVLLSGSRDPNVNLAGIGMIPFLIGFVLVVFAWVGMRPKAEAPQPSWPPEEPGVPHG